jgi:hypothetical protein
MKLRLGAALLVIVLGTIAFIGAGPSAGAPPATQCAPAANYPAATTAVAFWSTEARCAIVPPTAGAENFGNKFPGEAAVFMGVVHVAIYDAVIAIEGGYRPYAPSAPAPANTSPDAAIATAAYDTLVGLQNTNRLRLSPSGQAILDADYTSYMATIPIGDAKANGITVGEQVAQAILARRVDDGLDKDPTLAELKPPPAGPGVWQPNATGPVLGLRLPGVRPLALQSASQFRPEERSRLRTRGGLNALTSQAYADDFSEVKALGSATSTARSAAQTAEARFWTDHDLRQWNDGMLRLAAARGLNFVQTARMLAMAHVAGGDAMIACFDEKYHDWFWRPSQAIQQADTDGNPLTVADPSWRPLGAVPNFPEYPSAHACHSTAVVEALDSFFATDSVPFTLDSRVTGTTRQYASLQEVVDDVDSARVFVGFHFRNSDLQGSNLGREVGAYVVEHYFQPAG